jgi:hypothetical protein
MLPESVTPCDYARERHRNRVMWLNLWTMLLFIFGSVVVLFLCAAILFFIRQDWLPGALTTLGTIVQGVGIKWVADRHKEAVAAEQEAYQDVGAKCETTRPADELRTKIAFF